jgi:hypothetical protein
MKKSQSLKIVLDYEEEDMKENFNFGHAFIDFLPEFKSPDE